VTINSIKSYLGNKKIHTLTNQFIVLPGGEDIVGISIGQLGKISDITLFRNHRSPKPRCQTKIFWRQSLYRRRSYYHTLSEAQKG
jgi:hypothetical protein